MNKHVRFAKAQVIVERVPSGLQSVKILEAKPKAEKSNVEKLDDLEVVEGGYGFEVPVYFFKVKKVEVVDLDISGIYQADYLSRWENRKRVISKEWRHLSVGEVIPVVDAFRLYDKLDDIHRNRAIRRGKRLFEKKEFEDFFRNIPSKQEPLELHLQYFDLIHGWYVPAGVWPVSKDVPQ